MNLRIPDLIKACSRCPLHLQCKGPVPPLFRFSPIAGVGRNPGTQEDQDGEPFVGRSGELLNEFLEAAGWRRRLTYITNTVKCFTAKPRANRPPEPAEIAACAPWLRVEMMNLMPALIITTGNEALQTFRPKATVGGFQGQPIEITAPEFGFLNGNFGKDTILFPIYHPSFILRGGRDRKKQHMETAENLGKVIQQEIMGEEA